MDNQELQHELETASKAIQICANITRKLQFQLQRPSSTTNPLDSSETSISKSDFSPVTIGDFAVQALLTSALHHAFPRHTFVAEESSDQLRENTPLLNQVWGLVTSVQPQFQSNGLMAPGSKEDLLALLDLGGHNDISDAEYTWVFDPIDGTATFLRGQHYAINCALLSHGREALGIIGCPTIVPNGHVESDQRVDSSASGGGVLIYAVRGQGTWTRPMQYHAEGSDGDTGATLASPTRIPRHGDVASRQNLIWTDCATYSSTITMLHQQVAAKLGAAWPGVDLFSSVMKYAALGFGDASVCIRIFKYRSWRSNIWDHAGGVLVFEEAGGRVTDIEGKSIEFTHGRKMAENWGLVCAPSSVHAEVLRTVQEVVKSYGEFPWSK